MSNIILPSVMLVMLAAILILQMSGNDPARMIAFASALPLEQKIAFGLTATCVVWLAGGLIRQAVQVANHGLALAKLQERRSVAGQSAAAAGAAQQDIESAIHVLADSDPEAALASLDQCLKDAEGRVAVQRARNEMIDMEASVDDLRNRQRSLREAIGEVMEKRRSIDPVLREINLRQQQLVQSLAEIENDEKGFTIGDRLAAFARDVAKVTSRLKENQQTLRAIEELRADIDARAAELAPLTHAEAGLAAMFAAVDARLTRLGSEIAALEEGPAPLSARVEALLASRQEADRKLETLKGHVTTVEALRDEMDAIVQLQGELRQSLADAETDRLGRALVDRMAEFNAFAAQARTRLDDLESTLALLTGVKDELLVQQKQLGVLQDTQSGLRNVLLETKFLGDRLHKILSDLEMDGEMALSVRVNELIGRKREMHLRIASLADAFTTMDETRREIDSMFAGLAATLNTYTAPVLDGDSPGPRHDRNVSATMPNV